MLLSCIQQDMAGFCSQGQFNQHAGRKKFGAGPLTIPAVYDFARPASERCVYKLGDALRRFKHPAREDGKFRPGNHVRFNRERQ